MSLLAELKRRKVFRVAVVYVATAFVILQAADIMLPRLGVPDWAMSLVVVLVVLGFPLALILAWALELTPEGIRKTDAPAAGEPTPALLGKRTIFAAALLVTLGVGLGAGWFLRTGPTPGGGSLTPVSENASWTANSKSIAVLPFVNMSADAENEFFADGISEELLNVLVRVDDIGVASRTSSFAYKGREIGAATIARELNVNHILEGSVRKAGNRVRITAQLIDAVNDRHLWSETYDRELDDIFVIQDEIANAIVAALRGTLGSGGAERVVTVRADTEDLDAYQLYLKARELFINRERLDESVRLFEQAVALDPEFARGWEGLAAASAVIIDWVDSYPSIDRSRLTALTEHAAERALALDPSLSMPWAARSLLVSYSQPIDFPAALGLLDQAITADPRNATAYLWRGILWVSLGFLDRALADTDQCLAIDPAYGNCLRWKALAVLFQGDVDTALDLYGQGMASGFTHNRGNSFVEPLIRRGDRFAAILLMRAMDWPLELQQAIVATLHDGKAPPDVAALVQRNPVTEGSQFQIALLFRDYEHAADQVTMNATQVEFWDPAFQGLRASPGFKRILEQVGVPAYWRDHGYPPQCRPVGAGDYECAP
jgi:TolB-like protein/tetratricopeptide (TPR) repeat protein